VGLGVLTALAGARDLTITASGADL